jgi:hypothetical protein
VAWTWSQLTTWGALSTWGEIEGGVDSGVTPRHYTGVTVSDGDTTPRSYTGITAP